MRLASEGAPSIASMLSFIKNVGLFELPFSGSCRATLTKHAECCFVLKEIRLANAAKKDG